MKVIRKRKLRLLLSRKSENPWVLLFVGELQQSIYSPNWMGGFCIDAVFFYSCGVADVFFCVCVCVGG